MYDSTERVPGTSRESCHSSIGHLKHSLEHGLDWPTAFFETMALWTLPYETHRDRTYHYLIGGEAFDWLVLAERLYDEVPGQIPQLEIEDLLFAGHLPTSFDKSKIKKLLGVDRYRGYLNFYYGVTVEEALLLATEMEVLKQYTSNGILYVSDASEQAFARLYRDSGTSLMNRFRMETGKTVKTNSISVGDSRGFTYWLFKYRLKSSDKSRTASDTRKGLQMLEYMTSVRTRKTQVRTPA